MATNHTDNSKTITIYHNPRCSKSRQTLELLNNYINKNQEQKLQLKIIEYLKNPLSQKQVKNLFVTLSNQIDEKHKISTVRKMMRTKEAEYKENNLNNDDLTASELISYIAEYPVLLERPIVVCNHNAIICRPPELVEDLLKLI